MAYTIGPLAAPAVHADLPSATLGELTLGELLAHTELGLELISGGPDAPLRSLAGAHSIEVRHPARWLERGWVMLTTGLQTDGRERELVRELEAKGVAAIGFGPGDVHPDIPRALVEEAGRRDFPLFVVPPRTPFRDVISVVQRCLLSGDMNQLHRLTAMHRYLTDALVPEEGASKIAERLAGLLRCDVAVLSRHADATVHGEGVPVHEIAAALPDTSLAIARVDVQAWGGWAFPVVVDGQNAGWLVAGFREGHDEHPLLKQAAQLATPLIAALERMKAARRSEDLLARRAMFDALLDAETSYEARIAAARAESWGVHALAGVRVVACRMWMTGGRTASEFLEAIEDALDRLGVECLVTVLGDDLVILSDDKFATQVAREALALDTMMLVGTGRRVDDPAAIRHSKADALLVIGQLGRHADRRALTYEELDLGTLLVGEVSMDRIRDKVAAVLDPVRANAMAFETLQAYLHNNCDVGRTSRALDLHPNSTRYRLTRIEELIGAPLRRPATIAMIHFALLADAYAAGGDVDQSVDST